MLPAMVAGGPGSSHRGGVTEIEMLLELRPINIIHVLKDRRRRIPKLPRSRQESPKPRLVLARLEVIIPSRADYHAVKAGPVNCGIVPHPGCSCDATLMQEFGNWTFVVICLRRMLIGCERHRWHLVPFIKSPEPVMLTSDVTLRGLLPPLARRPFAYRANGGRRQPAGLVSIRG